MIQSPISVESLPESPRTIVITPLLYFLAEGADLTSFFRSKSSARDMLSTIPLLFGIIIALYWLNVQNRFPIYMPFNFFSTLGLMLVNLICLSMIFLPIIAFSLANLEQLSNYQDKYMELLLLTFHFILLPFSTLAVFINQFSFQEFIITLILGILGALLIFLLFLTITDKDTISMTLLSIVGGFLTFYVFLKYMRNTYTKRIKQISLLILAFIPWITLEMSSFYYTGEHFTYSDPEDIITPGTILFTILVSVFLLWFFQRKIRRPEVVR